MIHKYSEAKSNYVKNKIKITKWKDREYIESLLYFEKWVMGEVTGKLGPGWGFMPKVYESNCPEEFKAIYTELNLKGYKKYLKQKKEDKKDEIEENKEFKRQEKEDLKKQKFDWEKAGGK